MVAGLLGSWDDGTRNRRRGFDGDDLRKLPFTIKLSRNALSIIKQNITFALAIKLIALSLVIPGWLTLWIAILSDMGLLSSLH